MPNPEFFSTLRNRPLNGSNKRFYMSRMSWQSKVTDPLAGLFGVDLMSTKEFLRAHPELSAQVVARVGAARCEPETCIVAVRLLRCTASFHACTAHHMWTENGLSRVRWDVALIHFHSVECAELTKLRDGGRLAEFNSLVAREIFSVLKLDRRLADISGSLVAPIGLPQTNNDWSGRRLRIVD